MGISKILLIDESEHSTEKLKPALETRNREVCVIRSKEELLEHLKSYPTYDVILVEKDLPKMKKDKRRFDIGIEIAEMMKNRYPLAQVILFVSDEKDIIPSTLFDVVQRQSEEIIGAQIEQATLSALESQLDSAESQLSQINQIASALLSGRDLEDICRILVEGIAALNFDRVQLYLLDEAGFELRAFAEIGMMPNEAFSDRKWPLELLEYLHPTRIPDQPILHRRGADGGLLDHEAYIGRKSVDEWVSLPLTVDGELIGKISADTKYSGRQLCEKELDPLMGIARQGAIAIQKYRLQAKEREKNKILKVIHNVVSEVRGSVSPETVFATASKAAVELFPEVDHSALLLFERGNKYCEVVSEFPAEVGALGLRFMPQALGFEVEDLKRDGYVEIKDIAAESRLGPAQIEILEKNIRSALLYPLKNNSTVLGFVALNTLNRLRPRAIRPDLLELIDIFASNVSTAVINAQQIATVRSLNDIARALAVIKDKTEMLETIVTHAVKIVNGRYGGIEWINYDKGCIEVIADSYLNGTLVNCFPIEAGMAGYMLAERETCLHTESYADEPYAYQPFTEIGFEALVEVMLIQDDKPIGFLFVEDAQGRRFTRQDVENLQAFADHALVAIEQAELMESREQLSNQLHALHVIGDQIEGAKEVDEIIEYALFGLVSHHGLHYDRVAFFLIDPKDPNRLYGKGAYGFLDEKEWRAVDGNEEPSDYDSVNAQAKVFQIAQYYADTPLHKRIQGIDLNLADEDCHYLVTQILNPNRDTWYRDDNDGRRIAQCPEPIRTLFSDPGPRMIVSMAVEDRRIGFLIIDNPFSLREIPPAKRRALKTFVTSITVAIKNRYLISETKRRAEYQEILLNTGGAFANNTTAEETIRIILDKLKELIHAPIIKFVRINLEHVSRPNLWAPRLIYGAQAGNRPVADWVKRSGESIRVLESGQYLMVPEIEKSTHWLPHAAETLKMKSCVCFPAIVGENPVGVVWVYFDQIRIFAHEELQDWQIFVNQAASIYVQASSIDKLTMEQHLSRSAQEMVSINDIGSVFATVVRQASQALNENKVTVALYGYDRERQTLTEMDTFPPEDQALMRKVDLAERTRTVETILNAGEPIDFSFPAADPEIEKLVEGVSWHPLLPEKPYEAISIMPLIRHGQHLGVMAIGYEMPQRFTQSQTGSLRRLAHFAEVALANALALRGKEREIRRFNLLSKVNQSVSPDDTAAELVYHSLIRSIYDYMLEQGKDIVYCELRLRQGDFLKTSVVYPPLKAVSDREIYLNAVEKELGIAGNTFLSGKTTVIHDVDDEETYIRLFDETRSEICVPVIYEDLPLGILNLEFRQKNILDHNDVELLKAVASRFAGLIRKFHQEWQRRAFHQASQVIARAVIDN
ncbi:MAG: GAF domain-containing protein, partial [Chloroflexota bacterium]